MSSSNRRPPLVSSPACGSCTADFAEILAAQAPVALVLLDRQLRIQTASDRWLADSQYAVVPRGLPYLESLPEPPTSWQVALQACLTGARVEQPPACLIWPDGTRAWVRWQAQPWRDRAGRIGGAIVTQCLERKPQLSAPQENVFGIECQPEDRARQAGRRYYQMFAETAPVAIFNTDASGNCVYANQQACILTGRSRNCLQGFNWLQAVEPGDRPRVRAEWQAADQSNHLFQSEFRFQRPDGSQRWIYAQAQAIAEPPPLEPVSGYAIACIDVTDRKQFEEALRQSEARNRAIVTAIPDLMLRVDREGYYRDYIGNDQFDQHFTPARLGKHLRDVLPAELAAQHLHYVQQALATGSPQIFEARLSLNEQVWEQEIRVAVSGPDEVLVIMRDITERQQATAALQRFQQAVESASDAIAIADLSGRVIYFNAAFTQLYECTSVQELQASGGLSATFVDPEAILGLFSTALNGGSWSHEVEQRSLQDRTLHVLLRASAILTEAGKVVGFVTLATDISESKAVEAALRQQTQDLEAALRKLRRTQAQLVQTEKMSSLGQLVAGVAHEINNPVNFIYGNISHAQDYANDLIHFVELCQQHEAFAIPAIIKARNAIDFDFLVEDLPKLLHSMEVGADRIKDIVASLRNFSRMDEAEMKAVDIHEGIDSTLTILHHRLKGSLSRPEIEIVKAYSPLPLVECCAGQLNQVFMNIIGNAIDALDERDRQRSSLACEAQPSRIEIQTAQTTEDWIEIRIRDNGSGIPAELLSRLFDPFFTTKPIGKGTGLGLSISHQIVAEKHGGRLECQSTVGQGTTFTIAIPTDPTGTA